MSAVFLCNDGPHDSMNAPYDEVQEVQEERGGVYGEPQYNLEGIAKSITGYLENKWQMKLPSPITGYDVAMFNVAQKFSRLAHCPGHADSLLDAHSYLDLAKKLVK